MLLWQIDGTRMIVSNTCDVRVNDITKRCLYLWRGGSLIVTAVRHSVHRLSVHHKLVHLIKKFRLHLCTGVCCEAVRSAILATAWLLV